VADRYCTLVPVQSKVKIFMRRIEVLILNTGQLILGRAVEISRREHSFALSVPRGPTDWSRLETLDRIGRSVDGRERIRYCLEFVDKLTRYRESLKLVARFNSTYSPNALKPRRARDAAERW
jgi:hypothetical protein